MESAQMIYWTERPNGGYSIEASLLYHLPPEDRVCPLCGGEIVKEADKRDDEGELLSWMAKCHSCFCAFEIFND